VPGEGHRALHIGDLLRVWQARVRAVIISLPHPQPHSRMGHPLLSVSLRACPWVCCQYSYLYYIPIGSSSSVPSPTSSTTGAHLFPFCTLTFSTLRHWPPKNLKN
jgi:hypothetical protein